MRYFVATLFALGLGTTSFAQECVDLSGNYKSTQGLPSIAVTQDHCNSVTLTAVSQPKTILADGRFHMVDDNPNKLYTGILTSKELKVWVVSINNNQLETIYLTYALDDSRTLFSTTVEFPGGQIMTGTYRRK
jgi:hypothetical protein